jgi:hypothetical protein
MAGEGEDDDVTTLRRSYKSVQRRLEVQLSGRLVEKNGNVVRASA